VLDDGYGINIVAMAVPKRRTAWLTYIDEFIEQTQPSDFIPRVIERDAFAGLYCFNFLVNDFRLIPRRPAACRSRLKQASDGRDVIGTLHRGLTLEWLRASK
jgi:hypothetical protein